jgi:LysM repeat protein
LARHAALARPRLRRTLRLSAKAALGALVVVGVMAAPASAANREVKSGDTLSKIAQQSGTTWQELWRANPSISDPNLIFAGQTINVPDGSSSAEPTVQGASSDAVQAASAPASVWDRLAQCESTGNWSINTGNGFYGGLQFTLSSWRAVGGSGYPHQASKAEQIARAERLLDLQGWNAWPACSAKLGLR